MNGDSFKAFVLDQLDGLGRVECRPMFGGYGLSNGRVFFGILFKGRLYFKTGPTSLPAYHAYGMTPFQPSATMTLKTYSEVPVEILEDADQLVEWARQAIDAQGKKRKKK